MTTTEPPEPVLSDEATALFQLFGRTGVENVQLRFQDDEEPLVWIAVAVYDQSAEAAAATEPGEAVFRLAEQLIDGGQCTHCGRPTALLRYLTDGPLTDLLCTYQYDPELKTYRRSCEGDT